MKTYSAISGQSTYDVALNTYGTLDKIVQLVQDNNLSGVQAVPTTAQKLIYDDVQIIDQAIYSQLRVVSGPISSLFLNSFGRLVAPAGGYMVNGFGDYCIRQSAQASSSGSGGDFLSTDFLSTDFL